MTFWPRRSGRKKTRRDSHSRQRRSRSAGLTTILQPIRAGEMARIGPAEVRARYGVPERPVCPAKMLTGLLQQRGWHWCVSRFRLSY